MKGRGRGEGTNNIKQEKKGVRSKDITEIIPWSISISLFYHCTMH